MAHEFSTDDQDNEECAKLKESAANALSQLYQEKNLVDELINLQKNCLDYLKDVPKSKQAKIVRTMFDATMKLEENSNRLNSSMVGLCNYIIDWCEKENRSFLRMRIQNKLAIIYFKLEKYNDALELLKNLLYELKRKEDKQLLVEAQLVESKVHHALENIPKAKASLTSVKTTANSIYIVPLLQAEIDLMSGMIACDEYDYATAFSYFYETFEGYRSLNEWGFALKAFKYMLFSKVMNK